MLKISALTTFLAFTHWVRQNIVSFGVYERYILYNVCIDIHVEE